MRDGRQSGDLVVSVAAGFLGGFLFWVLVAEWGGIAEPGPSFVDLATVLASFGGLAAAGAALYSVHVTRKLARFRLRASIHPELAWIELEGEQLAYVSYKNFGGTDALTPFIASRNYWLPGHQIRELVDVDPAQLGDEHPLGTMPAGASKRSRYPIMPRPLAPETDTLVFEGQLVYQDGFGGSRATQFRYHATFAGPVRSGLLDISPTGNRSE